MREPAFWYGPPGFWSAILSPLGKAYAFGTKRRLSTGTRERVDVPVICIGNINVGGTGKTPTVIAVVQMLSEMGHVPHVVTRGFRGSLQGPVQVDLATHTADESGDEPLLIAAFAPVWIAKDRAAGARAAIKAGASIVVLDDGFQNPALYYDLSVVVVDAAKGFGNARVMPAGPLREPAADGLKRADALLSIGDRSAQSSFVKHTAIPDDIRHFTAQLEPVETGMDWSNARVFAFAGIGDPEKFFATLRSLGADVVGTRALDDHQPLKRPMLNRLLADAKSLGAQLVTTEKDAVRIPVDLRPEILSLPVRLKFDSPEEFKSLLPPKL